MKRNQTKALLTRQPWLSCCSLEFCTLIEAVCPYPYGQWSDFFLIWLSLTGHSVKLRLDDPVALTIVIFQPFSLRAGAAPTRVANETIRLQCDSWGRIER